MSLPIAPLPALTATIADILKLPRPAQGVPSPLEEVAADLAGAPQVALLAPDALGWYPFGLWREEMPFLSSLHDCKSRVLRAIMPTITPVNFAAMVSGAEQETHGIHTFNDDFRCETLFDVVRANGGQSAGVGRKGYTGGELLGRFADLWGRAASNTDEEVLGTALGFAQAAKPRFVIVQLGATDDIFHRHGPTSPEVVPTVQATDTRVRLLTEGLLALGYAVIVTADHGQHDKPGGGGTHGSEADEDALVPCTWVAP